MIRSSKVKPLGSVLCITPNPAIDRTLLTPSFQLGDVTRAAEVLVAAGGKGLNVARAVQTLGGVPLCMGLLGGHNGRFLADLAQKEALNASWTWYEGETRTCVIIVPQGGEVTVINAAGQVPPQAWQQFCEDVRQQARLADMVCISGSMPLGAADNAPADLIAAIKASGVPIWVDSSGVALQQAVAAVPTGIKVNHHEASDLLNVQIGDVKTAVQAAQAVRQNGIENVVITLGEQGAVFVNEMGSWWAKGEAITAVSAVGSGDSFFAGLLTALSQNKSPDEALRYAVAAGTANALTAGGGQFKMADFSQILRATAVSKTPHSSSDSHFCLD
ncbi:Ribokinase [hydrothermal vent metagenome]|uniref:Ribokinase n=1 Tax=hydrothermal vent metagenome TaxID=652676 RepID=A0A3B0VSK5_9ZZZZ